MGASLLPSFLVFMVMGASGNFDPFDLFNKYGFASRFEIILLPYLLPLSSIFPGLHWDFNLLTFISATLFNFGIGAFLGLLYGKFKNRNKVI